MIATPKSLQADLTQDDLNLIGRSYYLFCLETALTSVRQARALVQGDVTDENHQLPVIEEMLHTALKVT